VAAWKRGIAVDAALVLPGAKFGEFGGATKVDADTVVLAAGPVGGMLFCKRCGMQWAPAAEWADLTAIAEASRTLQPLREAVATVAAELQTRHLLVESELTNLRSQLAL
jgi:hypothetical protein